VAFPQLPDRPDSHACYKLSQRIRLSNVFRFRLETSIMHRDWAVE